MGAFIRGTNYRKRPLILLPEENPNNFRPSAVKLRNLRIINEKPFTFNREGTKKADRGKPLFWKFPEPMRSEMLDRFQQRLDYWEQRIGKRPKPGDHLYAKVVYGITRGFGTFWRNPALARACGAWGSQVWRLRTRIRKGVQKLTAPPRKEKRSKGEKSANVLGVV